MKDKLISRLENWKFESALKYVDAEDEDVQETVTALAVMFGNCGWMYGFMGTIINATVNHLIERVKNG